MASSPAHPDKPVTLKISFQGSTRRFTLPLSDVSSLHLLDKVRQVLCISPDASAVFERHSDSAASYVELDPGNAHVWKQLYRAAKAKRRLKLRVSLPGSAGGGQEAVAQEESTGPKAVTVEDEPEQQGPACAQTKSAAASIPACATGGQDDKSVGSSHMQHLDMLAKALETRKQLLDSQDKERVNSQPPSFEAVCAAPKRANFAVCCNHCDRTIPEAHYHCSICDGGDFDLCPGCVELGATCYNVDHWLLKRIVCGDEIRVSTTESVCPKPWAKTEDVGPAPVAAPLSADHPKPMLPPPAVSSQVPALRSFSVTPTRTCNSCVQELPDKEFLHCLSCEDFDLCKACLSGDRHGHHPQHAFAPAVEGTAMPSDVTRRLAAGRDQRHNAICDGCDKFIFGVRHKCLDCPDWDYCADCVGNAGFVHPNHRFVPIFEQMGDIRTHTVSRPSHYGISCDGPLCNGSRKTYIVGERFKCAVCHDTDFCANCEASPANTHNKTHPVIKFKTPVRRVEVTTRAEDEKGQKMRPMGDRHRPRAVYPRPSSSSTACSASSQHAVDKKSEQSAPFATQNASQSQAEACVHQQPALGQSEQQQQNVTMNHKQVAIRLSAPRPTYHHQQAAEFEQQRRVIEAQLKAIAKTTAAIVSPPVAIFERDTVADGTVMPPNQVFEQTWVLRNGGSAPWPAGCSVKFVGGDYMGHIDSSHPAGILDLVSASESTVCYDALAPGEEFPFTVLLRTPAREGKVISYWRLQSEDGLKFGHRLWCDVSVQKSKAVAAPAAIVAAKEPVVKQEAADGEIRPERPAESSQMIFPKVSNETPSVSKTEEQAEDVLSNPEWSNTADELLDDYELCGEDETWAEDSDEDILTDEEFDILDASDEEYIFE